VKQLPAVHPLRDVLWILQAALLLAGGVLWLVDPDGSFLGLLSPDAAAAAVRADEAYDHAVAYTQFLAPYAVFFAFATVMAVLRRDARIRRGFARGFVWFIGLLFVVMLVNIDQVDRAFGVHYGGTCFYDRTAEHCVYNGSTYIFVIGAALFFLYNLYEAYAPNPPARSRKAEGSADTKPPFLWALWMLQGLLLLGLGIAQLGFPDQVLDAITQTEGCTDFDQALECRLDSLIARTDPDFEADPDPEVHRAGDLFGMIASHRVRLTAPYTIGMALISFFAAGFVRRWLWTEMTRLFVLFFAMWVLVAILRYSEDYYTAPAYFALTGPFVLCLAGNLRAALGGDRWASLELSEIESTPGWRLADLPTALMMGLQSLMSRRRASHLWGAGALGKATCVVEDGVPDHEFFARGRSFDVVTRFATLTKRDDAALDVRGASIRLEPTSGAPHRFTLMMNTGSFCPASNLVEFATFVASKWAPRFVRRRALRGDDRAREGAVAGVRRAPDSFVDQLYYSQLVRIWLDVSGRAWLVRFRFVPATDPEGARESGLPDADDVQTLWRRGRRRDESRPRDYLRRDLRDRLALPEGEVEYLLQAQFHSFEESEGNPHWFDASADWPPDRHPWRTLVRLHLDRPLAPEETERLAFDPTDLPPTVRVPRADGWRDLRSMAWSEARVVPALQRFRRAMYNALGVPRAQ